jgi:phosphatidylserine decarboxylase
MTFNINHQYIDRLTGQVKNEDLFSDSCIRLIYSDIRERSPWLFHALTSTRMNQLLAFINYDMFLGQKITGADAIIRKIKFQSPEWVEEENYYQTARKLFERQIQYWIYRPMPDSDHSIVSPADARMITGSLKENSQWFIKGKFFHLDELLGMRNKQWINLFNNGDIAIFRLTPDKYHYNHTPVAGTVIDFYEIDGPSHSCNPGAVVQMAQPYSKNKRTVTIIDTDVEQGTGVGKVAMIEVTALMIGKIHQCYSDNHYENPMNIYPGLFMRKGQPKSLYQPGSSVDILIFESDRIQFDQDIVSNMFRQDVQSRFSRGFGIPLVETDVRVRSQIGQSATNKKGEI